MELICDGGDIVLCNKAFLCGRSKLLANLLSQEHVPGQGQGCTVTLAGVKDQHVYSMLELMATGRTKLSQEMLDVMNLLAIHINQTSLVVFKEQLEQPAVEVQQAGKTTVSEPCNSRTLPQRHVSTTEEAATIRNVLDEAGLHAVTNIRKSITQVDEIPAYDSCDDILYLEDLVVESPMMPDDQFPHGSRQRLIRFVKACLGKVELALCPYCPRIINTKKEVKQHIGAHFRERFLLRYPEARKNVCPICLTVRSNYHDVVRHMCQFHDKMREVWPNPLQLLVEKRFFSRNIPDSHPKLYARNVVPVKTFSTDMITNHILSIPEQEHSNGHEVANVEDDDIEILETEKENSGFHQPNMKTEMSNSKKRFIQLLDFVPTKAQKN